MVDRYAVFGNPIEHSVSPRIHQMFAQSTSQNLCYERVCVERGGFPVAARAFFEGGGAGLNITTPFKLDAYEFASTLSERARRAGAVNTLVRQSDGQIYGDNTDGAGLVADICQGNGWPLAQTKVLILGAGGAVRGVLAPLLAQQPDSIVIANRTVSKAEQLAAAFSSIGKVQACGFDSIPEQPFDLVINATSLGLGGGLPPVRASIFQALDIKCYDMIYGAEDTTFLTWVKGLGCCQCSDGLGMLVGQAAESFYLWRGIRPEQEPVISALRQGL